MPHHTSPRDNAVEDCLDCKSTFERPARADLGTVRLFGLLTLVSLALVWANNEFVMTKEVLHALTGHQQSAGQLEMQYEAVRRMSAWGYAMAPFQTAFRITFVALIVQMICLLGGIDIAYRKLFRVSAIAFWATLFGSLLQIFWITLQPATAITQASLGIVPDSLAAWVGTTDTSPSVFYLLLSRVSITSLLWMLLMYWGLRETYRLKLVGAATVTAMTWCIVSVAQTGTALFLRELIS